ncbi:MAG: alkaline phosphatase, partial [Alishewanella sp.]|nr:alkaline phosphatase [Alishewanella sp.]
MRALLLLPIIAFASTAATAAPKNIIYMIGDGMGPAYLTAYRYYQHEGEHPVANTIFDDLLKGTASTYPDDDTLVTDSAAGATALATGVKSYNGAISVNRQHIPIGTMMQLAKHHGKANGVVASSQVNHATPASFLAHNISRQNYNQIADMYFDYRINGKPVADVILGGGTQFFIREDRHLVNEFKNEGYQYIDNWQQLDSLTRAPALALMADVALPAALNATEPRQLATLTSKALQLLSPAEKGFMLMVEGSQIDWCGHDNDIACAMAEMDDFANAIAVAKAYVDANPDT